MSKSFRLLLLLVLLSSTIMIGCNNSQKQVLKIEDVQSQQVVSKPSTISLPEDTIYTDIRDVHNTAYLKDPKAYFRAHNKYAHWDKNDKRQVIVGFVTEKDGSTSHVEIKKSCDVDKLDKEALRLVKELRHDEPAKDINGNPIRVGNMVILIFFPAQ